MQNNSQSIENFLAGIPENYRDANLVFAHYAAFAGVFSPDMLYQFWLFFQDYEQNNQVQKLPMVVISDLLRADFCQEVAFELYEMNEKTALFLRTETLTFCQERQLKILYTPKDFASLTLEYAQQYYKHSIKEHLYDYYYWKSLFVISPQKASQELRNTLKESEKEGRNARIYWLLAELQAPKKDILGEDISKLPTFSYQQFAESINIEDKELAKMIAEKLGFEKIEQHLNLSNQNLSDISFLQNRTDLTSLDLSNNQISDISILKNLYNLEVLNLSNNQITVIQMDLLQNLQNLKELYLKDNPIEYPLNEIAYIDANCLNFIKYHFWGKSRLVSEFENNFKVSLSETNIKNIGNSQYINTFALDKECNIVGLNVEKNELTNDSISLINKYTSLIHLNLEYNKIDSLEQFVGLINLERLDLEGNLIEDITLLSKFPKLRRLDLAKNLIKGFADNFSSEMFKHLDILDLSYNQISDISFLQNLPKLSKLKLRNNQISDISILKNLKNLRVLDLSNNQITEIPMDLFESLTYLKALYLQGNPIQKLPKEVFDFEENCWEKVEEYMLRKNKNNTFVYQLIQENLRTQNPYLDLRKCGLNGDEPELELLKECKHLKELYLGITIIHRDISHTNDDLDNQITHFIFLTFIPSLEVLDIGENRLEKIPNEIYSLTNLTHLYCSYGRLAEVDFSLFESLKKLFFIRLTRNKIKLIKGEVALPQITWLDLKDNQISDISANLIDIFPQLTYLNLQGNPIKNLSQEIFDFEENCWEKVMTYLVEKTIYNTKMILYFNPLNSNSPSRVFNAIKYAYEIHAEIFRRKKEQFECHNIINLDSLLNVSFEKKIEIFHIDGVINKEGIQLSDKFIGMSQLKRLISRFQLKLIFIQTFTDTDSLANIIQENNTSVIYSESAVTEDAAEHFVSVFYKSLAEGKNIENSFNLANQICELQYNKKLTYQLFASEGSKKIKSQNFRLENVVNLIHEKNIIIDLNNQNIAYLEYYPELKECIHLEVLHLENNQITHIPKHFFDKLTNLKELYLQGNPIENLSQEIFDFEENCLENVKAYFAQDITYAKFLIREAKEKGLKMLNLGNLGLTSLEDLPELFELKDLEVLQLGSVFYDWQKNAFVKTNNNGKPNIIKRMPVKLNDLLHLKKLYFRNIGLEDVMFLDRFKNKRLKVLDLAGNPLSSNAIIGHFTLNSNKKLALDELCLGANNISLLPQNYLRDNLDATIKYLDLSKVKGVKTKDLEQIVSRFTNLEKINLMNNDIKNIDFLKNLQKLVSLDLRQNAITHFPDDFLDSLPMLQELYLEDNPIQNRPKVVFDFNSNCFERTQTYNKFLKSKNDFYINRALTLLSPSMFRAELKRIFAILYSESKNPEKTTMSYLDINYFGENLSAEYEKFGLTNEYFISVDDPIFLGIQNLVYENNHKTPLSFSPKSFANKVNSWHDDDAQFWGMDLLLKINEEELNVLLKDNQVKTTINDWVIVNLPLLEKQPVNYLGVAKILADIFVKGINEKFEEKDLLNFLHFYDLLIDNSHRKIIEKIPSEKVVLRMVENLAYFAHNTDELPFKGDSCPSIVSYYIGYIRDTNPSEHLFEQFKTNLLFYVEMQVKHRLNAPYIFDMLNMLSFFNYSRIQLEQIVTKELQQRALKTDFISTLILELALKKSESLKSWLLKEFSETDDEYIKINASAYLLVYGDVTIANLFAITCLNTRGKDVDNFYNTRSTVYIENYSFEVLESLFLRNEICWNYIQPILINYAVKSTYYYDKIISWFDIYKSNISYLLVQFKNNYELEKQKMQW